MITPEDYDKPQWHQQTQNFLKRFIKCGVRDLFLFVLVLAALETGLRFHKGSRYLLYNDKYTAGHPMYINSQHLREKTEVKAKPEGQIRIIALGNSTTFGSGVALEKTYAKQLEQILARSEGPGRYFVINSGGQGPSLKIIIEQIDEQCMQFEPNIAVLGFSSLFVARQMADDTAAKSAKPISSGWQRNLLSLKRFIFNMHVFVAQNAMSYVFFDHHARTSLYRLGIMTESLSKFNSVPAAYAFDVKEAGSDKVEQIQRAYANIEKLLIRMKEIFQACDIKFVVVLLPDRFVISNRRIDNLRNIDTNKIRIDPVAVMSDICRRHNFPYVDVKSRFKQERLLMFSGHRKWDELYNPDDYSHLNERGHQIVAEELYNFMKKESILPEQ